jgi:hypothetical protein
MQLRGNDEGSDPVRSAHVHLEAEGQELDGADSSLLSDTDPIELTDIDRVLEDSAAVTEANQAAPVRVWRDELTVALESLSYARSVLASDVGVLRHCLARDVVDPEALVDELPRLAAGPPPGGEDPSASPNSAEIPRIDGIDLDGIDLDDIDWTVCIRSDPLMTAHREMAQADLSSPEDVTRVLGDLEEQLAELVRRQDAVTGRLRQVRQAIVGQYERGSVSARDWLG